MARFIQEEDYELQIKSEIQKLLVENYNDPKLARAEHTAIDQIKAYLCGRYDMAKVFDPEGERDSYIVMTVIDLVLYHLYSSKVPNQLPEHRSQRYEDALMWLKGASRGHMSANLPEIEDSNSDIRIKSHTPQNHKW